MGTRLYPRTQNVAILEILAGVPKGTAAKLKEFEALPISWFGQVSVLAELAVAQKQKWDRSPDSRSLSVREHFNDLRSQYRRDAEFVKYLYRNLLCPELDEYHGFDMFGWGSVEAFAEELEALEKGNHYACGRTTKLADMLWLLVTQLSWCDNPPLCIDRRSWFMDRSNVKLRTRSGSVYLNELEGLCWS